MLGGHEVVELVFVILLVRDLKFDIGLSILKSVLPLLLVVVVLLAILIIVFLGVLLLVILVRHYPKISILSKME